jgi:uncharacterized protein (TIGR03067 family)
MNWLPAFGVAFALAAPGPKDAPKKAEPPPIVGEWKCGQFIGGGRVATEAELKQIQGGYVFTAEGKFQGRFGPETFEGTYTTDPAKDPPEIDCVSGKAAKSKGGIYKVEKDALTLCVAEGDGARPTKFESPAGTRILLMTFKRAGKKE